MIDLIRVKYRSNRNLIVNIIGSIGIKGLSLCINLLTVPAYMNYFPSADLLGVWFAILSLLNWIMIFDLGVGNGLRNKLVEAFTYNDMDRAKNYISSAYTVIGVLSIAIIIAGYFLLGLFNWNFLFNISETIISESILLASVRFVFLGVVIHFFLNIILYILYALQKTAIASMISLVSSTSILVFTILYKSNNNASSLLILSIVHIITYNIPLLIASIIVFTKTLSHVKPNIKFYTKDSANKIMKLGYAFFVIQITLLIINLTNEFLITRLFGPQYVVEYQVYNRIFSLLLTLFSVFTTPIWSSITKAYNENKYKWIASTYKYLTILASALSLFLLIIAILFNFIVDIWLGENTIVISSHTAFIFAIFYIIMIFIYSITCITNGIGYLKAQLYSNTVSAILKIPIAIILSNYIEHWTAIMITNILIMLPSLLIQSISINRIFRLKLKI